jgi:hypothetical protein
MRYKGFYRPKNISKYKGDHRKIVYRSKLELTFMRYCDGNNKVLKWSSEEVTIPYRSPIDGKLHRYFPDFWVKTEQGETLIEIKPKIQTKPPKQKANKRRYIREVKTWGINEAKWKAAEAYCKDQNWNWKILTESDLTKY